MDIGNHFLSRTHCSGNKNKKWHLGLNQITKLLQSNQSPESRDNVQNGRSTLLFIG
jgi:hypothetical protein